MNKDSGYVCNSIFRDVWRTSDGGLSWVMRNNGISSTGVRRLFFLDYNTGFCGASFTLFKTTNAGDNWVAVNGFSDVISSIFSLDEITGWVGLENSVLSHTTNGGINWIYQLPNFSVGSTTDIYFYDNIKGWRGTRLQRIIKTTNRRRGMGFSN
ncbi:MAG: hypothetical protein IPG78_02435 [Ignavibacteria bacterium]|nr:hypothetical protein [Ignavibacteria bacterium]